MELLGKKIFYQTLGCKLNFSETSTIRHSLEKEGALTTELIEDADICVINTCSVTDVAEKKGRQIIRKIKKHNTDIHIIAVGCYAQLRPEELNAIDGVDMVLSTKDKFKVKDYLLNSAKETGIHSCEIFSINNFDTAFSYGDRTRCFLKIQDGCNYFCSYCTIPYARGKSRSGTIAQVLKEVDEIAKKGIQEIILTGVNTGEFGINNKENLYQLIQALDRRDDIARYRISSIEPNLLTDDIIKFVGNSKHFMPHFHIPLQSGNNEVLKLMKRKYRRELFADKIALIRKYVPDAFIGVDTIVGMRGETREYFEDAKDFIKSLDISRLHIFPYSERKGTLALQIPHIVSQAEKHKRVNELMEISDAKLKHFCDSFIGQKKAVLFEESNHKGIIHGYTDNYIKIQHTFEESFTNKIKDIKITNKNILI